MNVFCGCSFDISMLIGWFRLSDFVILDVMVWFLMLSYGCIMFLFDRVVDMIVLIMFLGIVKLILFDLLFWEKIVVFILINLFVILISVLFEFFGFMVVLVWMKNW